MTVADVIFHGGTILTMDDRLSAAQAVAVKGDRILMVGSDDEIMHCKGPGTELVALEGCTVVPGFIDAHTHFELSALGFATSIDCRSPGVKSIGEIQERIRPHAAQAAPGSWIKAQGNLFQDQMLAERRYPNRDDLDAVSTEHPIVFRSSYHVAILNSKALAIAGIGRNTPDPPGGMIERDVRTGEPTGYTKDMYHLLGIPEPGADELREALLLTAREHYLRHGVTSVQEISHSVTGLRTMRHLIADGDLRLRISVFLHVPGTVKLEAVKPLAADRSLFDGTWMRALGVKLFADGGTTSMAAAFHEPYVASPDTCGCLAFESPDLTEVLAHLRGSDLQLAVHAVGDRAQDMVLDALATAPVPLEPAGRQRPAYRIEHAGNLMCSPERIDRMQQVGALPVPNPGFIYCFADSLEAYLGPERASDTYRFRTLLDRGFALPGNSDCTGTEPLLLQPLFGIWCAVNRRTRDGRQLPLAEAVTVTEGLLMYTRYAARTAGEEGEKGSIEPGKLADMVILEQNPLQVPPETLCDIKIRATWVGGVCAWAEALSLVGTVVEGDKRGRLLGYPTANLQTAPGQHLPVNGVYVAQAAILRNDGTNGVSYNAMLNLGWRPTFAGTDRRCEVHLLDFDGNLYGEELHVTFLHWLRDEQSFAGLDELKAQLAADETAARAWFKLKAL